MHYYYQQLVVILIIYLGLDWVVPVAISLVVEEQCCSQK
jgi:hypothetical protein